MVTQNVDGAPSAVESNQGSADQVSDLRDKYPVLCRDCGNRYHTFMAAGHPDDGAKFSCGIMIENMETGCMVFHCPYFVQARQPIIDAEKANAALAMVATLRGQRV